MIINIIIHRDSIVYKGLLLFFRKSTAMTENTPKRGRPLRALLILRRQATEALEVDRRGDAAAINEFKARLLASPRSQKVLDSILRCSLRCEHKNQAAAWKLLMDRMLPLSYFEKDKANAGRASVNITISGVGSETIITGTSGDDDVLDGEYTSDDN
jgi:hypothetical protein